MDYLEQACQSGVTIGTSPYADIEPDDYELYNGSQAQLASQQDQDWSYCPSDYEF